MATFFGEILESSSRAFWDDEDDFEDISNELTKDCELEIINHGDLIDPVGIQLFVLVYGSLTTGFAESCLLKEARLINEIRDVSHVTPSNEDGDSRRKPSTSTKLYLWKESVILCVCSPDLNTVHAHAFTELISRWMKISPKVIILTCEYRTSYTSDENDLPTSFLRELHTDNYKDATLCKSLEQPNLISNIPSGVLTWCQIFKVPAILYIVYTDSYFVDSISAQPLVKLFNELPFKILDDKKPNFKKQFYDGPETSSNLYI